MLLATRFHWRLVGPVLTILVGSLLAVAAAPVAAGDGEADNAANYSACVGPATESAGFSDMEELAASTVDAVNCLAHYRVTLGTASGAYAPRDKVSRLQMALFLIRAAGPAGIVVPRASDQGFTDIGQLPRNARDAINQLAALDITKGKTTKTFAPHGYVTRRQMALFLARFLDVAPVGEGGVDIEDVDPDDTRFTDIDSLSRGAYDSIRNLFEMGVTTGTSRTRFSPDEPVTRGQMALFITRMLAHTNARPAGVTMQTAETALTAGDAVDLVISVRDRNHDPEGDVSIDLFHATSRNEAFNRNGKCDEDEVISPFGGSPCDVDPADETTNGDGNLVVDLDVDDDLVLWVWTGELDDRFDVDDTQFASLEFTAVKAAEAILVTDDMHPEARKVPYGRTVRFTFQLIDEDEDPVSEEGVEIRIRREEENDNRLVRRRTNTYFTNSAGRVVLSYRIEESASNDDDDDSYLRLELLEYSDLEIEDETTVEILDEDNELAWSDEDEEPTSVVLEQTLDYHEVTSIGRGARNTVTATLLDQYGDPVRGERIHFVSDDSGGLYEVREDGQQLAKTAHRKSTSRRGQGTVRYYRDSDQTGIEMIEAFMEDDTVIRTAEPLEHYWVDEIPDDGPISNLEVLLHDEDRNILVLDSGSVLYVVRYDSNDHFNGGGGTETFDSFRENIMEMDFLDVDIQGDDPDDVNKFTR